MKALIFILFSFILMASASAQKADLQKDSIQINTIQTDSIQTDSIRIVRGKATYYASKFHGRRTTSGEIFSNNKMTAAHLTLPFGTMVRVTNIDNGRTIDVRVNDRGPHNKSFIIDISQAAAKEIGIYSRGVGNVEIRYILPKKY
ncbi:septal ring lytic transglycosylase RlpA family protein [Daejeonella sp. H1SJ63]|uniref:septal ring lytic transglycosylase RlpA family protein n=1 Tax=Daejeonella sp. H1SJ63 TaxID=3034145 RepID=UPI0023EAD0D1|nr:septal ring lytic transglycosylase RlpA family protein [Daejeonella sp. H1SJ63]